MILADADTTADGTLNERTYFVQNWRHDVVATLDASGRATSFIDYTPYGDVDMTDFGTFGTEFGDVYADTLGTLPAAARSRGYAGYVRDSVFELAHVRHRVYRADLGRWTRRDPLGYVDGGNLYGYTQQSPVTLADVFGLCSGCGEWGGGIEWADGIGGYTGGGETGSGFAPHWGGGFGWGGVTGTYSGTVYSGDWTPSPDIIAGGQSGNIDYGAPQFFDWNAPGGETSPRECFENYWPGDCRKFAECQAAVRMSPYPPGGEGNNECYESLFRTAYNSCTSWFDDRTDATNKINNTLVQCTTTNWNGGTVGGIGHGFQGCLKNCLRHNPMNGVGYSLLGAVALACGSKIPIPKWLVGQFSAHGASKYTGIYSIIQQIYSDYRRMRGLPRLPRERRVIRNFGRGPRPTQACLVALTVLGSYINGVLGTCSVLCAIDPYNY